MKNTKHEYIENYYINLIKNKEVSFGDKMPSENEMAELFGVSRHTVRQALTSLVSEGWIYKVKGKGSFYSNKQELKKKKNILVLTTSISNYIFPNIIQGIERELRENDCILMLCSTENSLYNEKLILDQIISDKIDGIIIEPTQSAINKIHNDYIKYFNLKNIKVVTINSHFNDISNLSYVDVDDEGGAYKLVKYLIKCGHRNIGAILKIDDIQGINRLKGYLRALKEEKIEKDEKIIGKFTSDNKEKYCELFLKGLLSRTDRPTAVFCYNDEVAMILIRICKNMGISIPNDLSIVSFDNSDLTCNLDLKITTIPHPKEELGKMAAKFILDMMNGTKITPKYTFKTKILIGNSVARIKKVK